MTRQRLVVLRALGLGDLLTAVPALRGLRRAFPQWSIELAAPRAMGPLIATWALADRHLTVDDLSEVGSIPTLPSVAVNLHGQGPHSHRALLALRPAELFAFGCASVPQHRGGPAWDPEEHEVRRWCRLLRSSGVDADPDDLDLPAPVRRRVPELCVPVGATLVHPGASSGSRRWPVERWALVAVAEVRAGHHVLVTGNEDERPLAERLGRLAGLPPQFVLAGKTDLVDLAVLVARAGRVVSGDTGVAHLATALGTPSVVLFGPTPPSQWGPPPGRPWHVALWSGRKGDPHGDDVDAGLLDIGPADVVEALERLPRSAVAREPDRARRSATS